eukprot:4935914-Amphidinium_carterae.1
MLSPALSAKLAPGSASERKACCIQARIQCWAHGGYCSRAQTNLIEKRLKLDLPCDNDPKKHITKNPTLYARRITHQDASEMNSLAWNRGGTAST